MFTIPYYPIKIPSLIRWVTPSLTWSLPNDDHKIYLTFDDGPIPNVTPWVLDLLAKHEIKATFFCIGNNVALHPELYHRILQEGHRVGNHTYDHLNGWKTADDLYYKNIEQTKLLIKSTLFRPPYGRIKPRQIKVLKQTYDIIMWDVLSGDFDKSKSPQDCYNDVINKVQQGSIIVMHDSLKAEHNLRGSLEKIITTLQAKNFVFDVL